MPQDPQETLLPRYQLDCAALSLRRRYTTFCGYRLRVYSRPVTSAASESIAHVAILDF